MHLYLTSKSSIGLPEGSVGDGVGVKVSVSVEARTGVEVDGDVCGALIICRLPVNVP